MRKKAEQLVVGRVYADIQFGKRSVSFFRYDGGCKFTLVAGSEYFSGLRINDSCNLDTLNWFELTPEEDAIYNKPSEPTFTLSDIQRVIERIENEMAECGYTLTEHGLRIAIEIMREELKLEERQ